MAQPAQSPAVPKRPLLMLIDGSHAVFRAFFAVRHLSNPAGQPTGAVFGYVSMLLKLLRDYRPERIGVCFDTSGPTPRHALSPAYKANRPEMPEDLQVQWPICQRLTRELGLPLLRQDGLEADDLIATLADRGHAQGWDVLIVSGDKDLMQLVRDAQEGGPRVRQLDDGKGVIYDEQGVADKWGVRPDQVGELLAIMGDTADNIPGVRGIGEKGAQKLIAQWGSLQQIYAHLDQIESPRTRELLRESQRAAQLAWQLVQLYRDAEIRETLEDLRPKPADRVTLAASFAELGFKRLTADYLDAVPASPVTLTVDVARTRSELAEAATWLARCGKVSVCAVIDAPDLDRTRPLYGRLVGLALSGSDGRAVYVPLGHQLSQDLGRDLGLREADSAGRANADVADVRATLGPLLADPALAKLGCGLKYELLALGQAGLPVRGVAGDAMLASYLSDAEAHAHTLRNIAYSLTGQQLRTDEEVLGKGKAQLTWDRVPIQQAAEVLGERAAVALRCCEVLGPKLRDAHVEGLYTELELPLTEVLAQMEAHGIRVDPEELGRQSALLATELAELEAEIHTLAGTPFNVGSPSQLGEILFVRLGLPAKKKTQTGYSTDQSVLEGLEDKHAIAAKVLRWRQLSKLKSTYTDQLPAQVHPTSGRVHTWFAQAVAATGRLSSIDPNLQNIPVRTPEGRRIRQAFVAAPGQVLISADYSQVELRVMAHLADDAGLQQAFAHGLDIHLETAARIFGLMPELVTPEQRSAAKTINFGVLYGMGAQRLARAIGVSQKDAKAFIDKYFDRFPAVRAWMDGVLEAARTTAEVRTLFGRRRAVPGLGSQNHLERTGAERIAINTPVQGTAADLIKRAMLVVAGQLAASGLGAKMLLQVHDELVLECPEAEAQQVADLVRAAMRGAGKLPDGGEMKAPLRVDVRWAGNWAEAH